MSNVRITTMQNLLEQEISTLNSIVNDASLINESENYIYVLLGRVTELESIIFKLFSKYTDTSFYNFQITQMKDKLLPYVRS